jgi:hypothetical protein
VSLGWDKVSFKCFKLYSDRTISIPFSHVNPRADVYFQIIDVGCDERVLSAIKERECFLFEKGFDRILGLRDLYSEIYLKHAGRSISTAAIKIFFEGAKQTIQQMSLPDKISLHFAIMEVEAWFLAMCNIFEKLDKKLTIKYIAEKLHFNLDEVDPQERFIKPSDEVNQIFQLIGHRYEKSISDVESICHRIEQNDIQAILESNRCQSFKAFYQDITSS